MKVLLIHNNYQYWGGEDTYVTSLKKLLIENGHTVILYSKDSKNISSFLDKIRAGLGLFWNLQTAKELSEIIKRERPDVAHFNNIYPLIGATAYYVCRQNKIKIVQTIHNYRFMCPKGILFRDGKICELCVSKRFFSPAIRFGCYHGSKIASFLYTLAFFIHKNIGIFKSIDTYIFPSKFTQQYYEKYFDLSKSRLIYIPYFAQINVPLKKIKKENWYLYVGRLSEEKGILNLLETFKKIPEEKLKIIGSGPLWAKVKHLSKNLKNVILIGHLQRSKLRVYYQKTKGVIIPSEWYETMPLVMLEALYFDSNFLLNANLVERWNKENEIIKNLNHSPFESKQYIRYKRSSKRNLNMLSAKSHHEKIVNVFKQEL